MIWHIHWICWRITWLKVSANLFQMTIVIESNKNKSGVNKTMRENTPDSHKRRFNLNLTVSSGSTRGEQNNSLGNKILFFFSFLFLFLRVLFDRRDILRIAEIPNAMGLYSWILHNFMHCISCIVYYKSIYFGLYDLSNPERKFTTYLCMYVWIVFE